MAKKNGAAKENILSGRFVYSTDPNFNPGGSEQQEQETLAPGIQQLRVSLDTKQRAGKAVTLVRGFAGTVSDLENLGKKMKTFCGTGGSVKNGLILIQGDHRDKLLPWLLQNGYTHTKRQ